MLVGGNRTTLVYGRNVDKRKSSRRKDEEDAECDQMGVKATKWWGSDPKICSCKPQSKISLRNR